MTYIFNTVSVIQQGKLQLWWISEWHVVLDIAFILCERWSVILLAWNWPLRYSQAMFASLSRINFWTLSCFLPISSLPSWVHLAIEPVPDNNDKNYKYNHLLDYMHLSRLFVSLAPVIPKQRWVGHGSHKDQETLLMSRLNEFLPDRKQSI